MASLPMPYQLDVRAVVGIQPTTPSQPLPLKGRYSVYVPHLHVCHVDDCQLVQERHPVRSVQLKLHEETVY